MYNDPKVTGQDHSSKQGAGNSTTLGMPIIGIVKDNIDPTRSGMIQVELEGSTNPGSSSKNSGSWIKVRYLSSFFGSVGGNAGSDASDLGTYKTNPSSYGMWHAPPDIGTKVVCIFINGDPSRGFYIGCIPEPELLQMVPAIGATETTKLNDAESKEYGGATRLPVTNLNINNKDKADSEAFLETAKPVHSYTAAIMSQQGIVKDPVRGPISSSASREAASRVGWGISTPGRPIYTGGYDDSTLPENLDQSKAEQLKVIARRGGHSIVMDDGDIIGRDQLIRIRTSLGHQILMSDDGQTLMILHSNGQSYIELGKEGTVDIFSTNSFNVRTQGDINFHADQHINLHALENLNIKAKNIAINAEEEIGIKSDKDFTINSLEQILAKSEKGMAFLSAGEASFASSGTTFINGSKINLNSGKSGISPKDLDPIAINAQTDTLYEKGSGWSASPGKLKSITTRTPAHAPWSNAGQGVDVKTSPDAKDNLPTPPSTAVSNVNSAANSPILPPSQATTGSLPTVPPISPGINSAVTSAILGVAATTNSSGPLAAAMASGAAVIKTISGAADVAAGAFGQTVNQLEAAGIIKPGAARMIQGLATSGKSIDDLLPSSVFSGNQGISDLQSFTTNIQTQTSSAVKSLQAAQSSLISAGIITGKEDSTQQAGPIVAAMSAGLPATIAAIQNAASVTTEIDLAIAAGKVAAQSASATELNGVLNSVNALNDINASVNSASSGTETKIFDAIKNNYPVLDRNLPVELTRAVEQKVAAATTIASTSPALASKLSSLASSSLPQSIVAEIAGKTGTNIEPIVLSSLQALQAGGNEIASAVNAISGLSGASASLAGGGLSSLIKAAKSVQAGGSASSAAMLAAGINNIPGGAAAIAKIANGASSAISSINGLSSLASASGIQGLVAGKLNGITNSLTAISKIGSVSSLLSSMASISVSKAQIKLPTVGINTYNRQSLTSQIDALLNDPGIPKPNLLGKVETT